ncbi:MAG: AMP-binding protein, partial [bacterium]|nr:AMP-binding protein [bacterium]
TNRMAHVFVNLGLKKGERVLLRLPNGPEFPVNFLGAVKMGAIPVPISPLFTWKELRYLIKDSKARCLVTTPDLTPMELLKSPDIDLSHILWISELKSSFPERVQRWQDLLKQAPSQFEPEKSFPEDPAYWLYTSGTTGQPKAAVHAHRSIRAHDRRARIWQDLSRGDVIFHTSYLNWSFALTGGMLDVWRHGLTTVIVDGPLSPERISLILRAGKVTTLMSVPGWYRRFAGYSKTKPGAFHGLRVCLSAGENLGPKTRDEFKKYTGLDIYEALGMTENSMYLAQPFGKSPLRGSVGQSVFEGQVKILGEDLKELPTGSIGILSTHISCKGLMLGYWDGQGGLEKPWSGDWFLSGDLARMDSQGNFFFEGRRDEVLTAGGYRISPIEVEQVLNQCPPVEESAVTSVSLGEGKNIVAAFIVPRNKAQDQKSLATELTEHARKHLAEYKIPKKILFRSSLPKTVTGKIKHKNIVRIECFRGTL